MQTIRTNMKNVAPTQYSNWNHTALCRFNGIVLGAGPGGLFKTCCGNDDAGVKINAYFIPYTTNLGDMQPKTPRAVYVGMQGDGELELMIYGEGSRENGPYTVSTLSDEGPQQRRFSVNRALGWVYGKFKFSNVNGSYFAVDIAQVLSISKPKRRA